MISNWPYLADPVDLFEAIADLPWSVFLDSGDCRETGEKTRQEPGSEPRATAQRYHLLSALPQTTLTTRGRTTTVARGDSVTRSASNPFALLRQVLQQQRPTPGLTSHPIFNGGAIGWFGYELGAELENIEPRGPTATLPDMAVGIYPWALLMDHRQQRGYLVGEPPAQVMERLGRPSTSSHGNYATGFQLRSAIRSNLDQDDYRSAFERIQHYLREGDCYQVNLARRFRAHVSGNPWLAYRTLREQSPAPYGAYLSTPYGQVLCNSPEQFLGIDAGRAVTRPIKGTRPRDPNPAHDHRLAKQLVSSPKDRAENVMIVDLLRNDFGRVCLPGSVRVEQLCALQSYATVHHLVSTITGQLAPGKDALDLLRAAFPGGSITGAPKHRAMQIIRELEPSPREVYCGSIGYLDWNGRMDSNIAIRTLVHHEGEVWFHAGGGCVVDSRMEDEYQETLDKAAAMFRLLES